MHTNDSVYCTHAVANRKVSLLAAALLSSLLLVQAPAPLMAQPAQQQTLQLEIAAGPLDPALSRLGTEANLTLLYSPALVAGKTTRGLSGRHSPAEALRLLLAGTGLAWDARGDATFVLRNASAGEPAPAVAPTTRNAEPTRPQEPPAQERVTDLQSMTVTGTRIRGGTTPSPLITLDSERIREEGFVDMGEVIRSVSQNFSGGQNPGVAASPAGQANQNITGGSSLNLRGLGPDATLTLLNGRRLVYDGFAQAVDISAIPVEAVERLEIVPDGASAIYGSDAVGGVANVVLKRDYEGVTVGVRYGTATEGGLDTRQYTITSGATWGSGGLIATYKNSSTDPLFPGQRRYMRHMNTPTTIFPGVDYFSALVSGHQSLGDRAEFRLDAIKSRRDQMIYLGYPGMYYYSTPKTSISLVAPSLAFFLGHDWSLTLAATQGTDDNVYETYIVTPAASTFAQHGCRCNGSRSYEVGAEGPLFTLGGGDARLAVGAGYRRNEFRTSNYIRGIDSVRGAEGSRFAYAEMDLPLVGTDSGFALVRRLVLTAAVRSEDYDNFGRVTTPKLGLIYDPSADFTVKLSWGKSFKAPTLYEQYSERSSSLMFTTDVGGSGYPPDATVLMSYGGNADLQPERARTWSASLAFHPEALPGLEAELTWFDIDFTDRVVQPMSSYRLALSNPNYSNYVDYSPTLAQQAALLETSDTFNNYTTDAYDPGKVVAILRQHFINAAQQRVKGIDLSGSYRIDMGASRLALRGSVSWLDSWRQNDASQAAYALAGSIFNPAEYKARAGAVWGKGGLSASGFLNYTSGVTSALTAVTEKMGSFVTIDATLRYVTGNSDGFMSGVALELSAQNLLNREPPFYTTSSITYVPYDSTNYSAIGRFVSVSVSKRF